MPTSTILSDNGVSSGTNGLKTAGGDDGTLILQTTTAGGTATTAMTINTTQQVAFTAGTAAAPSITPSGDPNTGIFFPAADTIAFGEGGAEAMRIDSSGNVGIGTSSPDCRLMLTTPNGTACQLNLSQTAVTNYRLSIPASTDALTFVYGASTERARITSAGLFKASNNGTYVGSTGTYHELYNSTTNENIAYFTNSAASPYGPFIYFSGATPNNTTNYFLNCSDTTNNKCTIFSSGTISNRTGTYNTLSDLKLKQDIVDANSQWDDIKALRIVKYRLKDEVSADPNYPSHIGVIAQEVEQVSPGLVDDCIDKDSGEVTKSVKSSIIYMKAVKALQEAMARIETLEAQNAAFEARLAALEAK